MRTYCVTIERVSREEWIVHSRTGEEARSNVSSGLGKCVVVHEAVDSRITHVEVEPDGEGVPAQVARDLLTQHGWILVLARDGEERWAPSCGERALVAVGAGGASLVLDPEVRMLFPTKLALTNFLEAE